MNNEKYNGWTNRETWIANLWLTNDQDMNDLVDETEEQIKEMMESGIPFDEKQVFIQELMNKIESILNDGMDSPSNGMFADLLQSAIANVNIREIAENNLPERLI